MASIVTISHRGNFRNTDRFFSRMMNWRFERRLHEFGRRGVEALRSATPHDTGRTADSWTYQIEASGGGYTITWSNSNVNKGVNIAVILQLGHGTRNGGYVVPRDYINPAIEGVFKEMAEEAWAEVTKA